MTGPFIPRASVICILAAALCACGKDEIQVYRVAKEAAPAPSAPAKLPSGHPSIGGGGAGMAPPASAPMAAADLHWQAPAGWKELPASGMRRASFQVPGPAGAGDLSVVVLPGPAGGTLANINRWRGQLGLGEFSAADLQAQSKRASSPAGPLVVVDFAGNGSNSGTRLLAAILETPQQTWFFKLTGPEATVAGSRRGFMEFIAGLHPADG